MKDTVKVNLFNFEVRKNYMRNLKDIYSLFILVVKLAFDQRSTRAPLTKIVLRSQILALCLSKIKIK